MYSNNPGMDASVHNIPSAYSTAAGSKILSNAPSGGLLQILHSTASYLLVTVGNFQDTAVPASTNGLWIPPAPSSGQAGVTLDSIKITKGDSIFICAPDGTVNSGTVYFSIQ